MISSLFRFHGHNSLRYVYSNGKAVRSQLFTIKYVSNAHRSRPRFSIVVSKKVIKSAVGRNRIRRRVYEIVRTNWSHLKPGHDMLISVYDPQASVMPYTELEEAVLQVLRQAHVWQDHQVDDKAN